MTDLEQKYLIAKEEYAITQKALYDIRTGMPQDKRLRSLSQRTDYEFARIQVSNAAKRMQEAFIAWKAEEHLVAQSEARLDTPEEQRARYGNVPESTAKAIFAAIEKGKKKA